MFDFNNKIDFAETEIDILTVGEVVIDIKSNQLVPSFKHATNFKRYFGGSPANIAMNLRKLGSSSALISKVGNDGLGEYLREELKKGGVDTRGVVTDPDHSTSIVLVTQSKTTPDFIPYRDADKYLSPEDIDFQLINKSKIVHLSSWLATPVTRCTMRSIIKKAKKIDRIIALDPNFRPRLWEGRGDGRDFFYSILSEVDIAKPSLDDAYALFGEMAKEKYIEKFHEAGVKLVVLSLGEHGIMVSNGYEKLQLKAYNIDVLDTTGAGDAFWAGMYASLVDGDTLYTALKVGSAAASLALQTEGALADLPLKEEIIKMFNI